MQKKTTYSKYQMPLIYSENRENKAFLNFGKYQAHAPISKTVKR